MFTPGGGEISRNIYLDSIFLLQIRTDKEESKEKELGQKDYLNAQNFDPKKR